MNDTPETDGQLAAVAHEPRDVAVRRLGAALRGMERRLNKALADLRNESKLTIERTRLVHESVERDAELEKAFYAWKGNKQ